LTSLIVQSAEPAGNNCSAGGIKVLSGLDLNSSGTLEPNEVTSTNYACSGNSQLPPPGCTRYPIYFPPSGGVTQSFIDPEPSSDTQLHVGSLVALVANPTDTNTCNFGATSAAPLTYSWELFSRPLGSTIVGLGGASTRTPFMVPDLVGLYQLTLQVTDVAGNQSAPYFFSVVTSSCGANAITPGPITEVPINWGSGKSDFILSNNSFTTQDNQNVPSQPGYCPPRFAVSASRRWSVLSTPLGASATLATPTAINTLFQGSLPGDYQIQVTLTASNGQTATATKVVTIPVPVTTP
jgi:hypothetical protein